ncbi:hypothetical protein HanRHA438_Chr12g0544231 [Helianthus annuus]|nr:hypothetical protein HanRHA438_Chr12g0544231 [Helianthus annuus]
MWWRGVHIRTTKKLKMRWVSVVGFNGDEGWALSGGGCPMIVGLLQQRIPPPDISQCFPDLHAHSLASIAALALQLNIPSMKELLGC